MISPTRAASLLTLAAALFLSIGGCNEDGSPSPRGNSLPETEISSESPRPFEASSYRVKINWVGSDEDGLVRGYYYAWDDTIDEEGHLTWQFVTSSESTFVVTADSCASPPCSDASEPFFDYHTFWVKAVDDQEGHDPTPAHRTFTATTVAPEVQITRGPFTICPGLCGTTSDYILIEWTGADPDGQVTGYWYKFDAAFTNYPTSRGANPADFGWTFVPSSVTSVSSIQDPHGQGCSDSSSTFAIYAQDDAGAIGQVPECGSPGNWVCFCPDTAIAGPGICIDGGVLGVRSTRFLFCDVDRGGALSTPYDASLFGFDAITGIFVGTSARFRWTQLPPGAGLTPPPLAGWRYAIDDPTALSPLSLNTTSYPDSTDEPWFPDPGSHQFFLQAVDRGGGIDEGVFQFVVSQGPVHSDPPAPKRILLVDDNGRGGAGDQCYNEWSGLGADSDVRETANPTGFWYQVLDGYQWTEWDTQQLHRAPGVPTVDKYTTIIWTSGLPVRTDFSYLREHLFRPRAEYLSSYVRAGGNVVLVGMNPLFSMMIRGAASAGEGSDVCGIGPDKGRWLIFDPSLCGLSADEAFPHFLFTRLGVRRMRVPVSSSTTAADSLFQYGQIDRVVRGCDPLVPPALGLFDRHLAVDSIKAGGDVDALANAVDWVPCANVTDAFGLEDWVVPLYYLDAKDSLIDPPNAIMSMYADGNLNPRRPASDPEWGKVVFLGMNPFFLQVPDATWYFERVLTDLLGEPKSP